MIRKHFRKLSRVIFGAGILACSSAALADDDLAAKSANPIASMISVPFEFSYDFGAKNGSAAIINVQPVVPVTVGEWNFISRPIIPMASVNGFIPGLPGNPSDPGDFNTSNGEFTGFGDINYSLFVSPVKSGSIIWGVGPSIALPTATFEELGTGKWSAGPTLVALTQPKPWTIGILARQIWSFAGEKDRSSVSQMVLQPFVNYALSEGWYLSTSPIVVSNWKAKSKNRWTVPLGGGVGRVFKLGSQPVNLRAEAYGNVVKPDGAPDWQMKFTFQFLFPRG
jgi:hypothetical protein